MNVLSASRQEHKGRMHKAANGRDRTCPGNVCVVYLNGVKESTSNVKRENIYREIYTYSSPLRNLTSTVHLYNENSTVNINYKLCAINGIFAI